MATLMTMKRRRQLQSQRDSFGSIFSIRPAFILFGTLVIIGCATYQSKVSESRQLVERLQFQEAADKLRPLALTPGDDQLVYLFDYGTTLQMAGNYSESNKILLEANDLIDLKDYHSVSRIAGSLALNQGFVQYKGEDYEKVIVNALLAINFLMLGKYDEALVETKRINEKLDFFIGEGKKTYQQNEFAYYLAATIWETNRQWDSAFIDYSKVLKLRPDLEIVKSDLLRVAQLGRRTSDLEALRSANPSLKPNPMWTNKDYGEVVLILQQGWGPRKFPRPDAPRFPRLNPVRSRTQAAQLEIGEQNIKTKSVYNLERVAIKTLDDEYATLVATRVAGVATKAVVANQIGRKNEALGQLAWIGMNLMDQADLRQWSTLPETFQVARSFVRAGKYKVKVQGLTSAGDLSGETSPEWEIEVKPQKKTYLNWRSVN